MQQIREGSKLSTTKLLLLIYRPLTAGCLGISMFMMFKSVRRRVFLLGHSRPNKPGENNNAHLTPDFSLDLPVGYLP